MGGAVMWARSSGPLAVDVLGYARELGSRGYAERTIEDHLRLIADLDRWMSSDALLPVDLTPERLNELFKPNDRPAITGFRTAGSSDSWATCCGSAW